MNHQWVKQPVGREHPLFAGWCDTSLTPAAEPQTRKNDSWNVELTFPVRHPTDVCSAKPSAFAAVS